MSTRYVKLMPGEFYHIYNRGNSKQVIFKDKDDYIHFIKLLYITNSVESIRVRDYKKLNIANIEIKNRHVSIGAYCLMPNHFHILLTPQDEGSVALFMLKLGTAYAMYFNKKYKRTGSLFEGSFKSQYIGSDQYLKYIYSYIHLNPIKLIQKDWKEVGIHDTKGAFEYLNTYVYSSFLDYMDSKRSLERILSREDFPDYFQEPNNFKKEIFDWINYKED